MASVAVSEESRLDWYYNEISRMVCKLGPRLLTRGMDAMTANEALYECLRHAEARLENAEKIIDSLRDYSVGMSFLTEEKIKPLVQEFWNA